MGATTNSDVAKAIQKQFLDLPARELGEILVRANVTSRTRIEKALAIQAVQTDRRIGEILVSEGWATEDDIAAALERQEVPPIAPKIGEILVQSGAASASEVTQALRRQ